MNNQLQHLQNKENLILNKLNSIANDKKKIEVLSIMNSELLEKLKYHEQANFKNFCNDVNNYFSNFAIGFLDKIISEYYLNIIKNIWNIRELPYIRKFFKIVNLILILWKKY